MSPIPHVRVAGHDGFPRVSGDEPDTYKSLAIVFSPRERG